MNYGAKYAFNTLVLLTAFTVLQGCGKTRMSFENLDTGVTGLGTPTNEKLTCIREHYYQPNQEITKKLDILFVTDTSGSLNTERNAIANGIGNFISQLSATADYQIAVTLAHGPKSANFGQLYKSSSTTEPMVLRSKELSISNIRTHLIKKLTSIKTDNDTDGGEAGLLSLNKAMDATRLAEIRAAHGFFRSDAVLAIVFVADENDICAIYPAGVTRVYDPDGKELPAFNNYCKNKVTANTVYTRLLEVQGVNPLLLSAIAYSNIATVPNGSENEFGYGYSDIVGLANGTMVDIAANDIPNGLADIGKAAALKMTLRTDYKLSYLHVDNATITAEVDSVKSQFSFDAGNNVLRLLSNTGKANSTVVLSYCLDINSVVTLAKTSPMSKMQTDNPAVFVPKIEIVTK